MASAGIIKPFRELLLHDDFIVTDALLKSIDTTQEKHKRGIKGLVAILTHEGKFDECFGKLLRTELTNQDANAGILRGSTPCTRLVTEYLRMHHTFLDVIVYKELKRVLKRNKNSEINPILSDKPEDTKKRTEALLKSSKEVFTAITEFSLPSSIKNLCITIANVLESMQIALPESEVFFSQNKYQHFAVSNTVFLHYICPFLAKPPADLLKKKNSQRTLIMFAKLFQALVNGATFDVNWMQPCNMFILENREEYENFCDKIFSKPVHNDIFALPARLNASSDVNIENRWKELYKYLSDNTEDVLGNMVEEKREEMKEKFSDFFAKVKQRRSSSPEILSVNMDLNSLRFSTPTSRKNKETKWKSKKKERRSSKPEERRSSLYGGL